MPTLQFKGKSLVWNHHLSVPFHTLDDVNDLDFQPEKGEGNLIIEGDNLVALKALIPEFQGKIKCIYIDPPYNTGNEGWIYNDKVNSPMISEWLGQVVGSDDLTKHDKWLCMMVPRLKLLRDLLSDDGVMFISIDDNEVHHLRQIMNEIFGEENFVDLAIRKTKSMTADKGTGVNIQHEYLLVFSKDIKNVYLNGELKNYKGYSNPDNDPNGDWTSGDPSAKSGNDNLRFEINNPVTNQIDLPPLGRYWAFSKETMVEYIQKGRIKFKERTKVNERGFIFKRYKNDLKSQNNPLNTLAFHTDEYMNSKGTKDLRAIFNDEVFDNPKPVKLIYDIVNSLCEDNDIILDSFAGSGTTMHAVMALNKEDGGNRKCIMIQMPENSEKEPEKNISKDITIERVKRAIEKYEYESGFSYKRVGVRIRAEEFFEGKLPDFKQFAEYVYFLATGKLDKSEINIDKSLYYVGGNKKEDVYLIYEKDNEQNERLALNLTLVNKMLVKSGNKKKIVYAPVCYLDDEFMTEFNFEFVNIPFNLFERTV